MLEARFAYAVNPADDGVLLHRVAPFGYAWLSGAFIDLLYFL